MLKKCDRLIRRHIRSWLSLPNDTPIAYFHASINDGGLGISSLRWDIPKLRLTRLTNLSGLDGNPHILDEIRSAEIRLTENAQVYKTNKDLRMKWSMDLYRKIDGKALSESNKVPNQHSWIGEGSRLLSGKDFINMVKLRINALPVRSRTSRGRRKDKVCRAGCHNIETLNHVLQACHRTHDVRVKRHNALTYYLARNLRVREFEVHEEPKIYTNLGLRKPDIVAKRGITAFVIDGQVVSESADLQRAHRTKVRYYKTIEPEIKEVFKVREVIFSSLTLTWRGIWSPASAEQLLQFGFLKKKEMKIMSTRALLGGWMAFRIFNRRTSMKRNREGIG